MLAMLQSRARRNVKSCDPEILSTRIMIRPVWHKSRYSNHHKPGQGRELRKLSISQIAHVARLHYETFQNHEPSCTCNLVHVSQQCSNPRLASHIRQPSIQARLTYYSLEVRPIIQIPIGRLAISACQFGSINLRRCSFAAAFGSQRPGITASRRESGDLVATWHFYNPCVARKVSVFIYFTVPILRLDE
jgi:hypothetical protein